MLHAIALYDCVADEEGELSFSEGTRFVDVVDSSEEDWLEGRIEGTSQRGLFPCNYVDVISVPSPSVVKSIPKTSTSDVSQGRSVSPPNSTISSSWSVISNAPTTTTPPTTADNNLISTKSDAFDTAIHGPSSSKYSDIATTLMNKRTMPKPTSTSKAAESHQPLSTSTTTLPKASPTLPDRKPVFKQQYHKPQQPQQTRARSFSASSTTFPATPRNDHDTTLLKPSALRQDARLKAQLDTSSPWRTKLEHAMPSSTARRPSLNAILPGNKMGATGFPGNDDEEVEEEDGYQLIKPSQLRKQQKQQQQQQQQQGQGKDTVNTKFATLSLSSSVSTSAIPVQKSSNGVRLQTLPSSSTLAKLPSRPVSQANRLSKSRSSSTRTNHSAPPAAINNISNSTSSKTAPSLKPKPAQLNKAAAAATKERSASNPPPIQPKNFTIDVQRPNKPALESKPLFPVKPTQQHTENALLSTPIRGGVALPGLGKKSSAPTLPIRPSSGTTKPAATDESIFKDRHNDDTNLKPSQLLTTQRARSSTNPSFATRPLIDTKKPTSSSKSLLTAGLDGGAIRSPPPPPPPSLTSKSSSLPAIPLTIIKQAPPPPPPSRHHRTTSNNSNDPRSRTRYDVLFDSIQDDGFVDGATARLVWSKSRLPNETLASIWQQCDQRKSGLLDRQRFIDGMTQIDANLVKQRSMKSVS